MAEKLISFALVLTFCMPKAQGRGGTACESLDVSRCAYTVSSSGMRCVLEIRSTLPRESYACTTSEIGAEGFGDWVETDECVVACGLDRRTVGISSDLLLDAKFGQKLCSSECYLGCPNIVNLYFNLAAGEGVFLPSLCGALPMYARRQMAEVRSSGATMASYESSAGHLVVSPGLPPLFPPISFPPLFPPTEPPSFPPAEPPM